MCIKLSVGNYYYHILPVHQVREHAGDYTTLWGGGGEIKESKKFCYIGRLKSCVTTLDCGIVSNNIQALWINDLCMNVAPLHSVTIIRARSYIRFVPKELIKSGKNSTGICGS